MNFLNITVSVEDNSYEKKHKLKPTMEKCLISEKMEIKMQVSFTYQIGKANFNKKDKGAVRISKNKQIDK